VRRRNGWAFGKSWQHRDHRGKIPLRNGWWAPSVANAWINVIVFHETGLRRILKDYFEYYERCRTHLSLEKDAPVSRPVELPSPGQVIEIPKVGGLHHLYTRKAA